MPGKLDLSEYDITVGEVLRNPSPAKLYEEGLRREKGTAITASGALVALSGAKTGRSPEDKRIVREPASESDIWWGPVNIPLSRPSFEANRDRAVDYLNTRERLFVIDAFAGWNPRYRLKVRTICERAYHALFMHNMMIRPSPEELEQYGNPDFVIFNAGRFPANKHTEGMTSKTTVDLSFGCREMVILGTEYAGEMKKGVFTVMHYLMPKRAVLSMHCSANQGKDGDVSLFFGLSGTGKTTLSTDPHRHLIGDDEHCWSDEGIFNIEGGCYAKVIHLSARYEPQIHQAIRFGSILENVVYDEESRQVDYGDESITTNTRGSYPLEYIDNARIPGLGGHPRNILFLTCDAFGVLPPVSRLTPAQAMYHFISGYTAKVAGTEVGVTDPEATFSACFGAPFLVWHPTRYAEMLAEKIKRHQVRSWLINTGWSGGAFGTGSRIKLPYTRAIIDAVHQGALDSVEVAQDPVFGLAVPTRCPGLPPEILQPRKTWDDAAAYDRTAAQLAGLFNRNFKQFAGQATDQIREAAPRV
ncbi:MAG: phosphoenolpyruvate carboxykinase (ATP) [Acidobacteriota bacterium]